MIPELFLFVSVVCRQPVLPKFETRKMDGIRVSTFTLEKGEEECSEKLRLSSSSVAFEGETAYRVIPATATTCEIVGKHEWVDIFICRPADRKWLDSIGYVDATDIFEKCVVCGKRRAMKTTKTWIEER